MKKVKLCSIVIALITSYTLTAQVAINTDGSSPDASAILDVKSTLRGLLMPRMSTFQMKNIDSPANGLLVYNTDSSDFYGFSGNKWIAIWDTADTIASWSCGMLTEDTQGNTYNTVQVGAQCWMQENLATTKYNDGIDIPLITDQSAWAALTTPAYCWYNNDSATYAPTYGALYNWHTINTGNLCPTGWHVPTDAEWKTLEMYLGMTQSEADGTGYRGTDEGGKLKEAGTVHWNFPNTGATNSSGFTALPGGQRFTDGAFYALGDGTWWWSATEYSSAKAWFRKLFYNADKVDRYYANKYGFSVRCVRN